MVALSKLHVTEILKYVWPALSLIGIRTSEVSQPYILFFSLIIPIFDEFSQKCS